LFTGVVGQVKTLKTVNKWMLYSSRQKLNSLKLLPCSFSATAMNFRTKVKVYGCHSYAP